MKEINLYQNMDREINDQVLMGVWPLVSDDVWADSNEGIWDYIDNLVLGL